MAIPKRESVLDSMGKEVRFPVSVLMAVQDQVSEPAVERYGGVGGINLSACLPMTHTHVLTQ